jgi:ribosomal protein S27AE
VTDDRERRCARCNSPAIIADDPDECADCGATRFVLREVTRMVPRSTVVGGGVVGDVKP